MGKTEKVKDTKSSDKKTPAKPIQKKSKLVPKDVTTPKLISNEKPKVKTTKKEKGPIPSKYQSLHPNHLPMLGMPFETWNEEENERLMLEWENLGRQGCVHCMCLQFNRSEHSLDRATGFRDHWRSAHMTATKRCEFYCPYDCDVNFQWT